MKLVLYKIAHYILLIIEKVVATNESQEWHMSVHCKRQELGDKIYSIQMEQFDDSIIEPDCWNEPRDCGGSYWDRNEPIADDYIISERYCDKGEWYD